MNPWNPSGERNSLNAITVPLTKAQIDRRINMLHELRAGRIGRVRLDDDRVTYVLKQETPQRTGTGPTYVGPVRVTLGFNEYAFQSDIPVALGDTVVVDTVHGRQEGVVKAFGTGSWNPIQHGALKKVCDVVLVRS